MLKMAMIMVHLSQTIALFSLLASSIPTSFAFTIHQPSSRTSPTTIPPNPTTTTTTPTHQQECHLRSNPLLQLLPQRYYYHRVQLLAVDTKSEGSSSSSTEDTGSTATNVSSSDNNQERKKDGNDSAHVAVDEIQSKDSSTEKQEVSDSPVVAVAEEVKDTSDNDTTDEEEDDNDDEWEYEEFEFVEESDFYNSEWKVGTVMDGGKQTIDETWCRLLVQEGKFLCIWGDGAKGKWNFDRASQFLSLSKETFGGWLGKKIWAGTVDDFYYLQGTVRGWSPISPASVVGQWQAKRLGISKDEDPGIAPWFQEVEEEEEGSDEGPMAIEGGTTRDRKSVV